MGVRAGGIFGALTIALWGPFAAAALAGPVGSDPSSNFQIGSLPSACQSAPTGAVCISAAVSYLNQARASLGQPHYVLPADFAALTPPEQAFILTNEDRVLYSLPPVTGLTNALDQDAANGVLIDGDPVPSNSDWYGFTSNWAEGYANMPLAYEAWMYDDGPGSANGDCTAADPSGCWGHRHDILWQFSSGGALAMGAAAGRDPGGRPGYAMLLESGSPAFNPVYNYTWAQAQADGANPAGGGSGTGTGSTPSGGAGTGGSSPAGSAGVSPRTPGAHQLIWITSLRVRGHRISFSLLVPRGVAARCSLTGTRRGRHHLARSKRCSRQVSFSHVPSGVYRLRVSSTLGGVVRRLVIR